jgi:dihydroneopterin triphosphate diphosphatase
VPPFAQNSLAQRSPRLFDCFVVQTGQPDAFLLLRRAPNRRYAGSWRMVAGKVDPGETVHAACLRELEEETGLIPEALFAVPYVHQFYEWQTDSIRFIPVFLARVHEQPKVLLDDEHDSYRWCTLEEGLRLLDWPGQREGLRAAALFLESNARLKHELEISLPEIPPS